MLGVDTPRLCEDEGDGEVYGDVGDGPGSCAFACTEFTEAEAGPEGV